MHLLRPIRDDDLPGLVTLARSVQGGLTTLPPDENFLRDRIDESMRAFSPRVKRPGGEVYLFVLEDTVTGTIVGTSGIAARVGGFEPFYSYEIRAERFEHAPLHVAKDVAALHLQQRHRGPTEIGSLFLRAEARRGGLGRLLSLARFLFIGAFRERFDSMVIAELRGVIDADGRAPFWEAVGRVFFDFDFYTADVLSGLGQKQFIADLMPRHPLYVPLLPREVQAVIGQVHRDTAPALALLRAEGFEATNEVDIFDAGPLLRAATHDIRTVRLRQRQPVRAIHATLPDTTPRALLANDQLEFRAALGAVGREQDGVSLTAEVAEALRLRHNDLVTVSPLR